MLLYRKIFFFLIIFLLYIKVFAYVDSDMDGVEDGVDKCPNTSLMELVDLSGCTTEHLLSPHHFDIIIGNNYTKTTDNHSNTFSFKMDYFYQKFSLGVLNAYYDASSNTNTHSNHTYLNCAYQFYSLANMALEFEGGLNIGDEIDYRTSLSGTYLKNNFLFLASMIYTIIGDKDSFDSDLITYNVGLGYYFSSSFYTIFNLTHLQSSEEGLIDDINSFALSSNYNLDEHYFLNFILNENTNSDRNLILNIGYYW